MGNGFTEDSVGDAVQRFGFAIVDRCSVPGRRPHFEPVPKKLITPVRELLLSQYPHGLYSHQVLAIEALVDGQNVCISTSTASGKSLVFIAFAAHLVSKDPTARVLCLYPARALIQDQMEKWRHFLAPLGLTPGFIDGGVPQAQRCEILDKNPIVLMTPDVAHAWLMSNLKEPAIGRHLGNLALLVLDEAHVYDGIFGTNMAYFLRRLQAVSRAHQMVCSTATLGEQQRFVSDLTGKPALCIGTESDGSARAPVSVLLSAARGRDTFGSTVQLLRHLAQHADGRFLAFGDSRRMVEQVVAAASRSDEHESTDAEPLDETADEIPSVIRAGILPYRAGYEVEDRRAIHNALIHGNLTGVVSTSALELGLDIGDIDLVIMLTQPPSVKAFWQRLGRGGRLRAGVCLLLGGEERILASGKRLQDFLERPLEPSWLYLENKYLQYANALCAAFELGQSGAGAEAMAPFRSLPDSFQRHLENELNPTEIVPPDLYPLKQRAQAGPHREFPIRTGIEQDFRVRTARNIPLGNLSFPQVLREAYPGAIYYYMARPYRVFGFNLRHGEITVRNERRWTTRALAQTMVFPRFAGGTTQFLKREEGFVAEAELQVSERVLGFTEKRGSLKIEHRYGAESPYNSRELNRFFATSGVCWSFCEKRLHAPDLGERILKAFCLEFGVQERDLGLGVFHSRVSPSGADSCQGFCIYDSAQGSLRLTQRLAEHFADVVESAEVAARHDGDLGSAEALQLLALWTRGLKPATTDQGREPDLTLDDQWVAVIASGERAMHVTGGGSEEVIVKGCRFTPQGLVYELVTARPDVKRLVPAGTLQPLSGETQMVMLNLLSGDLRPASM